MKNLFCTLAIISLSLPAFSADVPPPERLLPADTLGVLTIPDMAKARRLNKKSSYMLLWGDPSLRAFRDKFLTKLDEEIIKPFEQEVGIQLTNYINLAQGQFTVALTRNGINGPSAASPGVVLLIDAKGESQRMSEAVDELRKRWQANGNPMKTESIRGVEFSVLLIERDKLEDMNLPDGTSGADDSLDPDDPDKNKPIEFYIGQSGTLFLASTSNQDIEKILSLQAGGPVMSLAESTSFMPDYNQSFRDAVIYGWLNLGPVIESIQDSLPTADPSNPFAFSPQRIFRATGLSGIKTLAMSSSMQNEGDHLALHVSIPEEERRGLFRMLAFEPKDSAPPAFVPQDAVSFFRYRINMLKSWNSLETMISEISPQMGGMLRMSLEMIGKDTDATFDFRSQFVENLGDDVMSWRKLPRGNTIEAMYTQPEVFLLSSPNPDQLASTMHTLLSMIPPDLAPMEEREFLGRKVWSMAIPLGLPMEGQEAPPTQTIAFSSSNGYIAIASDIGLLEEFLRSSDSSAEPLINKVGLRFSSEKVGGMSTGLYGFSDDRETMRFIYKFLTSNDGSQTGVMTGLNQFMAAMGANAEDNEFDEWIDLSLLPPFGQIEKYFNYTVYSGEVKPEGYQIRMFTPRPRGL